MAFTAAGTVLSRSACVLKLLYTTDASGAATDTMANATLQAAVAAAVFPAPAFQQLLAATYASQAAARAATSEGASMVITVTNRVGQSTWDVDVDIDGSGLLTLVVTANAGVAAQISTAVITIEFRHTETR